MKRRTIIPTFVLLLGACQPRLPCPDCDDDAAEQPEDLPVEIPDLPCGGADLQTDDANCGECGNMCWVRGTGEYEAGHCSAGVCGPSWVTQDWVEPSPLTCDDVCGEVLGGPLSCWANGCAGLTGLVCESVVGQGCDIFPGGSGPLLAEFTGSCSETLPWPDTQAGGVRVAVCCCG